MAPTQKKVRKAVFPVGGLGTRFLPATKAQPKEMLPVVDKPLIQYAVEEAQAAGIEEFIFVTGRGKTAIEDHFDISFELKDQLASRGKDEANAAMETWLPGPGQVSFTRQQRPLGLGHAVWCARALVGNEPFAVVLADDLMLADVAPLKQMVEAYEHTGGNLLAVERVPRALSSRYGILDVAEQHGNLVRARGIVEKPKPEAAPSDLAVIGRYILVPEVFDVLSHQGQGAGGEIQLTDALQAMMRNHPLHGILCDGTRFDCGDKAGFVLANVAFALRRNDIHDDLRARLRHIVDN